MGFPLSKDHLRRFKDVAMVLRRHGGTDLFESAGVEDEVETGDGSAAAPEDLARDLERLGPTFIKLGQLLSTRADLLPAPYLEALGRLQDDVDPLPFAEIEEALAEELGVRPSRVFVRLHEAPLGSASLAQVHQGVLRSGREVAVKVQRPGIREQIALDLEVLSHAAELLDAHTDAGRHYQFAGLVEEFRKSLLRELDFSLEARNLGELRENLAGFDRLHVPAPIADLSTSRVLTMDLVRGRKVTDLAGYGQLDIDGDVLAEQLVRAYLEQILVHGFLHADPHPGNVLLTEDGRLALIDVGMTVRLPAGLQERLIRLLVGIGEADAERVTDATISISTVLGEFDRDAYASDVANLLGRIHGVEFGQLEVGGIVAEVSRLSSRHGLRPPPQVALLGKTLLNLDEVARTLSPEYDPNEAVRESVADIMSKRMWREASPGNALHMFIEAKEFVEGLPGRLNRILDTVANGRLRVEVDAVDEHELMRMAQKVANRVTAGLVLAALIVGASLLMQIEVEPTLFGYPALAIVLFLAAAAAAAGLLLTIFFSDEHRRFRRKG